MKCIEMATAEFEKRQAELLVEAATHDPHFQPIGTTRYADPIVNPDDRDVVLMLVEDWVQTCDKLAATEKTKILTEIPSKYLSAKETHVTKETEIK